MECPHLVKTVWLERVNHKFVTKSSYDNESPHTSDQVVRYTISMYHHAKS